MTKWAVIVLFAAATVFSCIFAERVKINYNLADYLGKDTQTKTALDIIDGSFGMTGSMQVMVKDISVDTAEEIQDRLSGIDNVLNVAFDGNSETYYRNGNALFTVTIDGDDYSDSAEQVISDVKDALSSYEGTEYGGTAVEKQALRESITSEMTYILAGSLCLVAAILLITSESWIEPVILLVSSGAAVLINRGTNAFFGEISYITNSVSAILQLALSIDYSIVLLHAYRREKEKNTDSTGAMKTAVLSVIKPVSASALTTVAGLLALLFMSFRIGFDIGIVLMKGIVISAITSVTLLPALVLVSDRAMKKLSKKPFVPKGGAFCRLVYRAGKVIVPCALAIIIACGVLQTGNTYIFSDTGAGNSAISDVFGNNNTIVAVYRNSLDVWENEKLLADRVKAYRTSGGKAVLSDYTAYSNTVLELYDVKKAAEKLNISESDAELLITMYNLYRSPESMKMSLAGFIDSAASLAENDSDAKEFADSETLETLRTLKDVLEITGEEYGADELYEKLTGSGLAGDGIAPEQIKQLYGMYFYNDLPVKNVGFTAMLDFMIAASESGGMADAETVAQLKSLSAGIKQYEAFYPETDPLRMVIDGEYGYGEFLPVLSQVAEALTGTAPSVSLTEEAVQQVYIMYFTAAGVMPQGKMTGAAFAEYALSAAGTNPVISAQLTGDTRNRLTDMLTVDCYCSDTGELTYDGIYGKLTAMQNEMKSVSLTSAPGIDEVSGVFIKEAANGGKALTDSVAAIDLLDFVTENMDTNTLLSRKMSDGNRKKVADAQEDIKKADDLFVGEEYSRMLLSVDLPNESDDTTEFVDFLSAEVKSIFGDDAYIAGETVSTRDLAESFGHDNRFITVFTLVSIFVIVMVIFRSLSLPVILVAVIQGAIFIAMSTQLAGNGIFFMSYIVSTCILMGATIDYGILMSNGYVAYRAEHDRKEALELSVGGAMPTVFTSGMILTVCGFIIHFVSSQNSVSTVGLLIGIGTVCSVVMITVVLPAVLYLLDGFILKLSLKRKAG